MKEKEKSYFEKIEHAHMYMSDKDSYEWEQKIKELYEYLKGESNPKGLESKFKPKLSRDEAFHLIWFLQEITKIIPVNFEACSVCDSIYDSDREGHHSDITGKFYCDNCAWDNQHIAFCDDCGIEIDMEECPMLYSEYLCDDCRKKRRGKAS